MLQIGVVGLSYRHAAVESIARFTLPKTQIPSRLPGLREALRVSEVVYLSTCNRVEVVFAMPEGVAAADRRNELFRALIGREPEAGEAAAVLRAWTGEAAVEHLFMLACGLDSAQVGEREITAQLRLAWEAARTAGVSGPTLDRILSEALRLSRNAPRAASDEPPSLADLAVSKVLPHLRDYPGTVALVGVSPMTRRCAGLLREAGVPLVIVNRTAEVAEELAGELAAKALPLETLRAYPPDLAAVIVATGGTGPVLDAAALAKLAAAASGKALVVDFGLPPNVDPDASRRLGIARIGMDELIKAAEEQRLSQLVRLAPVRAAIDQRLARLRSELATRAIGPRLAELRESFEQVAAAEVEKLLATQLRDIDPERGEQVRRWARSMALRLAHLPLSGMRAAAEHASAETLDAFFEAARLRSDASGEIAEAPGKMAEKDVDAADRRHRAVRANEQDSNDPAVRRDRVAGGDERRSQEPK